MSKTELIDVNDKLSMYKKQYKILLGLNYDSAPEQEQVEKLISDLKTVGLDVVNIIEEFLPGKEVDVDLVANTDFYMKMCLWQIRCYTINSRERDKRITEALEHEEGNVPFLKGCFVKGNMALMVHVVTLFLDSEVSFNDLYNAGEGLIKAVEKFDYRKGYKFRVYATWWIRYFIKRELSGIIH